MTDMKICTANEECFGALFDNLIRFNLIFSAYFTTVHKQ